jgi:hypothetical protein
VGIVPEVILSENYCINIGMNLSAYSAMGNKNGVLVRCVGVTAQAHVGSSSAQVHSAAG